MDRPVTTLFMLMSLDGKISTGEGDRLDFDRDLPLVPGVADGLLQYYELERETDPWSLNTGRVMAKVGANELPMPERLPVSFAIVDNAHLTEAGVRWLCDRCRGLVVITSNAAHPARTVAEPNLSVMYLQRPSLSEAFCRLRSEHGCKRLTVQSGGTLNAALVREGLVDFVDVVVAPLLVGGRDTPTLVDGPSLASLAELSKLCPLELLDCEALRNSYVRLRYRVALLS
ncbi:MAG: dihydrofolate reductase family protein [Atopobiaceae bacterium]|nr:dihydrofolate reductase family protein [Atopobiaceae bacterium]